MNTSQKDMTSTQLATFLAILLACLLLPAAALPDGADDALRLFDTITETLYADRFSETSPPYSHIDDNTYWSLSPGTSNDEAIWDVLTQPITVYDDGVITSMGHVFLRANPDGTGEPMAQVHGLSQGLHVIGETNEFGHVLVETFSNYDPDYHPQTPEERYTAFDICQGFLPAAHLKTIAVNQHIGLVVDKLSQQLYIYRDGSHVTSLPISTGHIIQEKYYYETIPGEFITIGKTEGFWTGDSFNSMGIRINGGTLLHEIPHTLLADGTRYYGVNATKLGSKASAGCIRLPADPNEDGYNMAWLYSALSSSEHYKVIVWDDRNRYDTPAIR